MMKYILAVLLALSGTIWATSYTAVQTGHFNTTTTWTPVGHPGSGDTWTIPNGFTVTCDSTDGGCASGTAAATTCTVDGTVDNGGTLKIGDGGTLVHAGSLEVDRGATLNMVSLTSAATLTIKPGSGASCRLSFANAGGSTGAAFTTSGASNTAPIIINGDMTGGGSFFFISSASGGIQPILNLTNTKFVNCGNSGNLCTNSSFLNSGTFTWHNVVFVNSGGTVFTFPADGTSNIDINGLTIINPLSSWNFKDSTAPTTASRTFKNMVAYVDTTVGTVKAIFLAVSGAKCGSAVAEGDSADVPCLMAYNAVPVENDTATDTANIINRESFGIYDMPAGNYFTGMAENGQMWQDGIVYARVDNPHEWAAPTTTVNAILNQYTRNICDGDGAAFGDTGNFVEDNGRHVNSFNLDINACGELDSDQGTNTGYRDLNNTTYQGYGVSLGNTGVSYPEVTVRRNLFVFPYDPQNNEGTFQNGLTVQGPMARQANMANNPDYNGYYMMPGSGDTDPIMGTATLCGHGTQGYPCPIPNATNGTQVSYVGVPVITIDGPCTTAGGTTTTFIVFTGCSTSNMQVGDYVFLDLSPYPSAQIITINSGSSLTVNTAITGLVSGKNVSVSPSYWATPGIQYGTTANYGTHDIHANPNFVDPTRNVCSYYVRVGGGTAPCSWNNALGNFGDVYTATTGSGGTTINDTASGINFLSLGIVANNDWVRVGSGSGACASLVTVVTATSLTLAQSCSGLASGSQFTFITALRMMARAIVTLNGWDYQGNATTPVPWATTAQVASWIRNGYSPQNLLYHNAGDDGSDIGAVPVTLPVNTNNHSDTESWR